MPGYRNLYQLVTGAADMIQNLALDTSNDSPLITRMIADLRDHAATLLHDQRYHEAYGHCGPGCRP